MKRLKRFTAVAALLFALITALLPAAAATEVFIPSGALAPSNNPDMVISEAVKDGYKPAAALAPALYPDGIRMSADYKPAAAWAPAFVPDRVIDPQYEAGSCGTHVLYYYDKRSKVLGFSLFPNVIGGGAMWDYKLPSDTSSGATRPPWLVNGYASDIKSIVFAEGVKNVGANAFIGLENVESVTIPPSVSFIGPNAFYGLSPGELTFLGMTPPVVDSDAFHPAAGGVPARQSLRYPVHAKAAYESLLDNGAANWSDLAGFTRSPFEDIVYVPPETSANDTPMIYDVQYDGESVSYSLYVRCANSALYAGKVVRVTYNDKLSQDITLDANGKGYGSFPAQPGEANFGLALLTYPSTRSNKHFQIIKPGMVNAQ